MNALLGFVVVGASDVFVEVRRRIWGRRHVGLVETALEDGFDVLAVRGGIGTGCEDAAARSVSALSAVGIGESNDAEAGSVGILGSTKALHGATDDGGKRWTLALGPALNALRRPAALRMLRRPMGLQRDGGPWPSERALMRGNTLALVKDLDDIQRRADLHLFAHESSRHAVEALAKLHVVVDVDGGAAALNEQEFCRRKRLQSRALQLLEH